MESYEKLENLFAQWMGLDPKLCVACSSGTAALHLALESLPFPSNAPSTVLVPDFTMVACARAVVMAGHKPAFADCNANDLNMNALDAFTPPNPTADVKAIMPVHIYGRRCDMDYLVSMASRRWMLVVEDLAEAHGIKPHPGSHAACWSFYKNKIIPGEEGGMVAFKNKLHADKARCLRCQGFTPAHDFIHVPRGVNYRLANTLAELVMDSLEMADQILALRRRAEEWFNELMPAEWQQPERDAPWVYDLRIPGLTMDKLNRIMRRLDNLGVPARHGFKPMRHQPEFMRNYGVAGPNAVVASREVLYFPISPTQRRRDVYEMAVALRTACTAEGVVPREPLPAICTADPGAETVDEAAFDQAASDYLLQFGEVAQQLGQGPEQPPA